MPCTRSTVDNRVLRCCQQHMVVLVFLVDHGPHLQAHRALHHVDGGLQDLAPLRRHQLG